MRKKSHDILFRLRARGTPRSTTMGPVGRCKPWRLGDEIATIVFVYEGLYHRHRSMAPCTRGRQLLCSKIHVPGVSKTYGVENCIFYELCNRCNILRHGTCNFHLYCVDLEVWSKLATNVHIMRIASKYARDFDCDWQCANAFSHCVTLIRVLLSQIISYSDTKIPVLVVMECKRANVIYVYELIFLLHTSSSTQCRCA